MSGESAPLPSVSPAKPPVASAGKRVDNELPADEPAHEQNMLRVYQVDSPEGAPFTPALEGSFLVVLMVVAVASVIVAGIVVGILFGWGMGLAVFGLGLCLAVGGNPEVWASVLRVQEHRRLERQATEEREEQSVSGGAVIE